MNPAFVIPSVVFVALVVALVFNQRGYRQAKKVYLRGCPYEFCDYLLKFPGTMDRAGEKYVVEACPGCERPVMYKQGAGYYVRIAEET